MRYRLPMRFAIALVCLSLAACSGTPQPEKDKPFDLLGVNSDPDIKVAKQGKVDHHLPYRSWWDGYAKKNTGGPIATEYGVTGWPTIYVLDWDGVIRFAGLRHEDSLKAVAQLMAEARQNSGDSVGASSFP